MRKFAYHIFLICFAFCVEEAKSQGYKEKDTGKEKAKAPLVVDLDSQVFYTADGKVLTKEIAATRAKEKKEKEIAQAAANHALGVEELSAFDKEALSVFTDMEETKYTKPSFQAYKTALKGYNKLVAQGKIKKEILTIIDYSLSSTQRRMWVIDMKKNKILFQTVVAHGRNSGLEYATSFSNTPDSFKSSLGFFKTAEIYIGENGLSLRLDGLEPGINHNARDRAIVMHGSVFCNEKAGKKQGYLERSLGCPALPMDISKSIIQMIKNESCLFIYSEKQNDYFKKTKLI